MGNRRDMSGETRYYRYMISRIFLHEKVFFIRLAWGPERGTARVLSKGAGLIILLIIASLLCAAPIEGAVQIITPPPGLLLNASSGPDYSITKIVLPDQISWIDTGTTLSPAITIRNLGADDIRTEAIEISAFLGAYKLIPQNNTINSMKHGEEQNFTFEFLIPDITPSGEYPFIISIDKDRDQPGENIQNTSAKATKLLTIRTAVPKGKVNGCGCS